MPKLSPVLAVLLLLAPAAFAQGHAPGHAPGHAHGHAHGDKKGPHGGPLQDVIGVEAELVTDSRTLTLHVYDEAGKPLPAAGFTGSALVGAGAARQVVPLAPGSGNTLSGTAPAAVARGTPVTVQLKGADGKSGQARF